MRKVLFNDITLRDGEQSPGVNFYPQEKLQIARQLRRLNLPIIEAGFAVASQSDWDGVNLIAQELGDEKVIICSMARAVRKDIEAAFEALKPAKKKRIQVVLATSDLHLEFKLKMTRAQALKTTAETVAYARSLVDDVEFAAEDSTRSDPDFLCSILHEALKAGARTLELPDTVGYSTPAEYGALVRTVLEGVPGAKSATISTHCHDDLGLATANTLAGLAAGANQAECTINGIGERAGNAPFEEVIMAIKTRASSFGVDADINTSELTAASRLVEKLAGMAVAPNKAIVGKNAFRHESGIHQHGMLCNRETYQIIDPAAVGADRISLDLGKLSGKHALEEKIVSLGLHVSEKEMSTIYSQFKDLAAKKKIILDDDVSNLVMRVTG